MKLVILSCHLLSLAGVSHQFVLKKFLKLGLLGGTKLGLKKYGESEETCRRVPEQQCKNVDCLRVCDTQAVHQEADPGLSPGAGNNLRGGHLSGMLRCPWTELSWCSGQTLSDCLQGYPGMIFWFQPNVLCTFNSLCWLILPVDVRKSATLYSVLSL